MGRIRGKETKQSKLSNEHDKYKWITVEDALDMDEPLSHHANTSSNLERS